MLVSGPAGIGKTTLIEAVLSDSGAGELLMTGRCLPLGQNGLPYAPLADALRSMIGSVPLERGQSVLEEMPELVVALLPERAKPSEVGA